VGQPVRQRSVRLLHVDDELLHRLFIVHIESSTILTRPRPSDWWIILPSAADFPTPASTKDRPEQDACWPIARLKQAPGTWDSYKRYRCKFINIYTQTDTHTYIYILYIYVYQPNWNSKIPILGAKWSPTPNSNSNYYWIPNNLDWNVQDPRSHAIYRLFMHKSCVLDVQCSVVQRPLLSATVLAGPLPAPF
jgi:hypothetical protein